MTTRKEEQLIQEIITLLDTSTDSPDKVAAQAESKCWSWVRTNNPTMTEEELQEEYEHISELIASEFVAQFIS